MLLTLLLTGIVFSGFDVGCDFGSYHGMPSQLAEKVGTMFRDVEERRFSAA